MARLIIALSRVYRSLLQPVRKLVFHGRSRYCPVCRSHVRKFLSAGADPRPDARCPVCFSFERHRLVWSFLKANDLLRRPRLRILHIAPEKVLESKFREVAGLEYLTADLLDPRANVKMDITDIQLPDHSFDLILCSHVLEHVDDDRKALRELERVLAPGGLALLMIPVTAQQTYEDPSVTCPEERRRLFGQVDHVRCYGPDVVDRFREAGFQVASLEAPSILSPDDLRVMSVPETEVLFSCSKP